MHKLHRDPVPPAGLSNYRPGQHTWGDGTPTQQERQGIWDKLNDMQDHRCAYCEGPISEGHRHIEHFRQRSRYPQGTFAWGNLFGSCNRKGTCGDHKDKCGVYSHADLIKPDVEDPEQFLVFDAFGGIAPRSCLQPQEHHRASESIRILALDGALQQIRFAEVQGYVQTAEYFANLANQFPQDEWQSLLQEELDNIASLPYATAIRHVLTNQSVTS